MEDTGADGEDTARRAHDSAQDSVFTREDADLNTSAVGAINCFRFGKAMAMTKTKNGFNVCELNTTSGACDKIFSLDLSKLPTLTDVSACGINPVDRKMYCTIFAWNGYITRLGMQELDVQAGIFNSLYQGPYMSPMYSKSADGAFNACNNNPVVYSSFCSMFDWKSYVIRVDTERIEYVAQLPPTKFAHGAFSPELGIYFISTVDAQFLPIHALHLVKGYENSHDKELLDLSGAQLVRPGGFKKTGGLVVVRDDLERQGIKDQYLISLHGKRVYISQYRNNFTKNWVIPIRGNKWSEYNVAWSFQGHVFFSAADGSGVFQIPLWKFDLSNPKLMKKHKHPLEWWGESELLEGDGINCPNEPLPWISKISRFDCERHREPTQVVAARPEEKVDGYIVKNLDLETGKYTKLYSLPRSMSNPPFYSLNAVGISPIDGIAYAVAQLYRLPAPFYLVRFDNNAIEFVAKLKGPSPAVAGTFDSEGSFFYLSNPVLKRVGKPHLMRGYPNAFDPRLTDLTNIAYVSLAGASYFGDIVAVVGDLAKEGQLNEYVLALNNNRQLAIVDYKRGGGNRKWLLPTTDFLGEDNTLNLGAAWNYGERVFWSANSGAGVFEVDIKNLDLSGRTNISVTRAGKSEAVNDNDGMNCLVGEPISWVAKRGRAQQAAEASKL